MPTARCFTTVSLENSTGIVISKINHLAAMDIAVQVCDEVCTTAQLLDLFGVR